MLFRKKIDRFCSYCVYAGKLDDETYLCAKRGFVAACHHCRKFKYDPLKRVPKCRKPKDFSEYDEHNRAITRRIRSLVIHTFSSSICGYRVSMMSRIC